MRRALIVVLLSLAVILIAALRFIATRQIVPPKPVARPAIQYSIQSEVPDMPLQVKDEDLFYAWITKFDVPSVTTLILPASKRSIVLSKLRVLSFKLVKDPLEKPDISTNVGGADWEQIRYDYIPEEGILTISLYLGPDAVRNFRSAGTVNLGHKINDAFLLAIYMATYQMHQKTYTNYLDFQKSYDSIQTDLYTKNKFFISTQ